MKRLLSVALLIIIVSPSVLFADINRVTVLQSPVWLVRAGKISPLKVGSEILAGDRIRTGQNARVVVRLGEGSDVKLGGSTQWILDEQNRSVADDVFNAIMSVAKGAFRFTTTALSKGNKRNISARLNTATIGIRGTDVWGRVDDDKTFVVLLEGKIEIEREGRTTVMSEALSLYNAPNGQQTDPLSTVAIADLGVFAQQTEPQAGQGVQASSGQWQLNAASYLEAEYATKLQGQLNEAGYSADIQTVEINAQTFSRVVIGQFVTEADAETIKNQLQDTFQISPWINRND
ncbi:MAG: FecR domain-containing protein [Pseudomonadota bacterium]